jgi:hypothetical protein
LTQMAVGFGKDMDQDVIDTISYWLNVTCAPGSAERDPGFYSFWLEWAGTGDECGYGSGDGESGGTTIMVGGITAVVGLVFGTLGFLLL